MSEEKILTIELERLQDYSFKVDFGREGIEAIITDEGEPLGKGAGPNPSMLLAVAMGNCLSSSLLFCLQKARAQVKGMKTKVDAKMTRNERGRWRITEVAVELTPEVDKEYVNQMERCIALFDDFCIVSKSVEKGIPLKVKVNWASS
ncbi:MAG: OsmC family protein [Candidatus Bathyarchaeota archaeon]|nr:OsmC family protein [Candidatus Bathyarchaeota archaeon]